MHVKWTSGAGLAITVDGSTLDRSLGRSVARAIIAGPLGRSIARFLGRSVARSLDLSIARSIVGSPDRSIARSFGWTVASKNPPSLGIFKSSKEDRCVGPVFLAPQVPFPKELHRKKI